MGKLQKNLTDLAVVLANHLGKSEKLQAFCQERYQKKQLIAVGDATEEFSPTKADAPYIFFYALWKEEGIGKLECSYHCNLSFGISVDDQEPFETEAGVKVFAGSKEVADFAILIQKELDAYKDGMRPVASIKVIQLGALDSAGTHWVTDIECEWTMEQTLSTSYEEEF